MAGGLLPLLDTVRPAHKTCLFRNSASTPALRLTLPITVAIAGLLVVLVVSYCPGHRGASRRRRKFAEAVLKATAPMLAEQG
jgi:hypothetical protein